MKMSGTVSGQQIFFKETASSRVIRTQGEAGLKLLRRLICSDAAKLASGEAFRSAMLNASGGVMQEVRVLAVSSDSWELALLSDMADTGVAWAKQVAVSFDAEVTETPDTALWLGGKGLAGALEKTGSSLPKQGRFVQSELKEGSLRLARFGGLILACGVPEAVSALRKHLEAAGAEALDEEAWKAVRVSECLPAYGYDYDEASSPLECGFAAEVDFSDASRMFIGRALTEARSRAGVRCRFGALKIDAGLSEERLESDPEVVLEGNDAEAGVITTWAKTAEGAAALALLPAGTKPGDRAEVLVQADGRDCRFAAEVISIA